MNNRYICKAKRKDNGKWVEGYYVCLNENCHRIYTSYAEKDCGDYYPEYYEVIPKTVSPYTGLEDMNGKWIFENDMLTMPAYRGGRTKSVVYFKNGKFAVDGSNYAFKDICPRNMEVIGNIFDNPELLS